MKHYIFLVLFSLFFANFSLAQDEPILRSGTPKIMEEALKNPEKRLVLEQLEAFTQEFIANMDNRSSDGPYIIPLVVHVIHNYEEENISYEQVDNALHRLNEDFQGLNDDLSSVIDSFTNIIGSPGFEFRLATKDPNGDCTYGVNRVASQLTNDASTSQIQSLANWDDRKYVNIYVVRAFESNMSSAAAYAVKPGSGSEEYGDYIFFRYDYFGDWNISNDSGPTNSQYRRHVPTHEMGHFMNLDHPWGGNNDPAQEENCAIDDGVDDTPQTIGTQGGCPLDQASCDGSLDNVQNFMEYSDCICMFTQGQANRMLAAANSLAGNRWYLWQEDNLIATGTDDETFNSDDPYMACAPIPDFKVETDLGCAGTEMLFENFTYNYRDASITYSWDFEGGVPSSSNNENPIITYDAPGSYDVSLTACRDGYCNTIVRENAITILSQMYVSVSDGLSQGFESPTFPDMDSEIWWGGNSYGEQHWERTELASSEGNSSLKIKSQNYGFDRRSHAFSTPELNLSEFTTSGSDPLVLCFDIAYAKRLPYNAVSFDETQLVDDVFSIHNDALIISYKGCGNSPWSERPWISTRPGQEGAFPSQQQSLFTTDEVYFNSFIPNDSHWQQRCINIQQLAGDDEAVIKFEFKGTGQDQDNFHWVDDGFTNQGELITASTIGGNWLYLDNIIIGSSSMVENEPDSRDYTIGKLLVSPNPSLNNTAWVSFETYEEGDVTISISNFLGLYVGTTVVNVSAGIHDFKLSDLFDLKKGSYIVSIQGQNSRLSDVLIIR